MSNAAMAALISTGLYMFFFIACLFLLRQPQLDKREYLQDGGVAAQVHVSIEES